MVLTRTDENELLTALHSAVFLKHDPWRLFLTRLRDRTEADLCQLFIRAAGEPVWRLIDAVRARIPAAESLAPDPIVFEELRGGRVYAGDELPGKREGRERILRVNWPEGGELTVSLFRRKSDFRARDSSLLASLSPHLTIALRSRMEVEMERRRNQIAERVLSRFVTGWLLLDARARVLDGDTSALRLIEEGRVMRRAADGHLRFFYPEAEALLDQVNGERTLGPEPRSAWLSVDPAMQMVVMRPPASGTQSLATPHSLLILRGIAPGMLDGGRYLSQLFRLTRSEAALTAEMAEGASLAEAAETLGLTIETARNYSKRIYVKTGARGQADLVRIVLNGTSMIG